jgi:plastocyanin
MAVGGGSGSGAMGGAGGMTTTTSMGTTGGTGGTGGSGGSGGSGGGMTTTSTTADLLNGCDPATAEDHTADATTTVNQSGLAFAPQCIRIKAGSSVKFVDNFVSHPLVGGTVANGAKMPDANSPIKMTNSGTEATFMFPDVGKYGYYCDIHALSGMVGAVFVE